MHLGRFLHASFTKNVVGAFFQFFGPKTKRFAVKSRRILEVFVLQGLQKKVWAHFLDFCVQKRNGLLWSSDALWKFSRGMLYTKCSGCIFTICASKNEANCCEIQTHFGNSLAASFTKKVLGPISRFIRPKTKLSAVKFGCLLEVFAMRVLWKTFWVHFLDFCVQNRSCLPWSSDAFWKFSACKVYRKSSWRNFTIYVWKNEAFCREVQTHFGSFVLQGLQKMFWAPFHDICVQKRSCLLWSSDAFWKFSLCEVYRKSFGRIFSIFLVPKKSYLLWSSKLFAVNFI